jgi:sarcosine oxidase subunit gamma
VHDLIPTLALGGQTPRRDEIGAVTIVETPGLALASVAARLGQEAACTKHLARIVGCPAPGPGKAMSGETFDIFWTGPEQWMVAAPFGGHEALAAEVKAALGETASVTEQTDAWVVLDLAGSATVDMLERLCPVPSRRMAAGDVQRTTVDHLGCFVWCRTAGRDFRIIGPRSAAHSLHHALTTAARSVA